MTADDHDRELGAIAERLTGFDRRLEDIERMQKESAKAMHDMAISLATLSTQVTSLIRTPHAVPTIVPVAQQAPPSVPTVVGAAGAIGGVIGAGITKLLVYLGIQ